MSGKVVLSFVLGAAAGAAGMYFGMKQACEVYIDKEIEQFKADYEATRKEKPEEKSKDLKEMNENLEKDAEKALKKYASATQKSISSVDTGKNEADAKLERVNYAKIRTPDIDKIDEIDVEKNVDCAIGPVVIDPSDYMEDDGLKRVVWNYLPKENKVYSEDGTEEIMDGIELLGEENLDSFGEFEVDTLYVKNAREGVKIDCIQYEDMTYDEFLEEVTL
ncbi:hypothetical protein [Segatella sp.]|uniref:hypothetical protein n=1 Tax=Segatella sp. TaxID=2974253 RepID=UPI003AAE5023